MKGSTGATPLKGEHPYGGFVGNTPHGGYFGEFRSKTWKISRNRLAVAQSKNNLAQISRLVYCLT